MDNQFYLLWLADGIKPTNHENYIVTSVGKAPKSPDKDTLFTCFLSHRQVQGKVAFYDSSFDIYSLSVSEMNISEKSIKKIGINDYYSTQSGHLIYFGNSDTFIEYVTYNKAIYLFDFNGEYRPLLDLVILGNNIQTVYSKKKITRIMECHKFFFINREFVNDDFVVREAQKSGLIGDYKNPQTFNMGTWRYDPLKHFEKPLLMWPRKKINTSNALSKVDYYTFIKGIQEISEFNYEEAINELAPVTSLGGSFYILRKESEVIGYACIEKVAMTYMYVSYLSIKEQYRKSDASKALIDSLKVLAKTEEKNLILTIEVHKLLSFYLGHSFKIVGQWKFD